MTGSVSQHGQHGVIALRTHAVTRSALEYFRTLLCAQPITCTKPELLDSFHAANPSSQLGTQQASVGGFVSQPPSRSELMVDGVGGQMSGFQIQANSAQQRSD